MRIRVGSIPSILFFSLTTIVLLSFGLTDDAFAARAGSEFSSPTQQNAYASYNTDTNDVQVEWNFNTLPTDTTCLLKGDFVWYEDLNDKHTSGKSGIDYDKVTGFIPIHYSVVSSSPTVVDTLSEVIPCIGSMRIDLDTIMSHSENINNYGDLEIFLSFYVANADGSFNMSDLSRIDEVFVLYTPVSTWDTAAQQYGCGDQIGSVLYIDQSGVGDTTAIHGNNGDNCIGAEFEYVALNSNQWVDIGMDDSPGLALGVELKGDHIAEDYSLLILVVAYSTSDSGGCDDCIDPTFYYSQNKIIVKDGFRYNGFSTNVTGNLHTGIPLLFTYTNYTNFLTLKVYDNFGTNAIEWIDVAFGSSGQYASFDQAEVRVEAKFSDNEIIKFDVFPPNQNLIDFGNATSRIVDCGYFGTANCLQITIPHKFNDELVYPGIVIVAEDASGNKKSQYLNDGLKILGESLNVPPTDKIFIQKYLGDPSSEWVDIVRIDRVDNIWSSEDGIELKQYGGGFQRITPLGFDGILID